MQCPCRCRTHQLAYNAVASRNGHHGLPVISCVGCMVKPFFALASITSLLKSWWRPYREHARQPFTVSMASKVTLCLPACLCRMLTDALHGGQNRHHAPYTRRSCRAPALRYPVFLLRMMLLPCCTHRRSPQSGIRSVPDDDFLREALKCMAMVERQITARSRNHGRYGIHAV